MLLAGYDHFLSVAEELRWDERALDLRHDAENWPQLGEGQRRRLTVLLAGFCIGEAAFAGELEPFAIADDPPERAACFRAQAADEGRHARFFDRVAVEVACAPGQGAEQRRDALRAVLRPEFCELFEVRLPAAARRLGVGAARLGDAVGLYHMVLEGVVFTAGQLTMLELLGDVELPGLRGGVELVLRDERWHLGFGARVLQDVGIEEPALERLLAGDAEALDAWGDVLDEAMRERVARQHRRRLRAVGLAPATPAIPPRPAIGERLLDRVQ